MTSALASFQAKNKLLCTARIWLNFAIAIHLVPRATTKADSLAAAVAAAAHLGAVETAETTG